MPASTALIIRSLRTYRHVARILSSTVAPVNCRLSSGDFRTFKHEGNTSSSYFEPKASWRLSWYYAAAGLLAFSSTCSAGQASPVLLQESNGEDHTVISSDKKPRVIFVLGGPGSGKGTQCAKIADSYGFMHLSAGELLRAEIISGSKDGDMISQTIKEGKIVPSEVTVRLLKKAMRESGRERFLIDGFPRNEENRVAFESITGIEPEFVIYLDCTEEEMEKRLLSRNQGRLDDNIETIRKRFHVFLESSLPVVRQYEERRKVYKINGSQGIEDVFKSIQPHFLRFLKEDLLQLTKDLLQSIDTGDYETYKKLCDPMLTAFEPEAQGHLVEGLGFHKFYFDQNKVDFQISIPSHSEISNPRIVLLGDNAGLVTYTRLHQNTAGHRKTIVGAYNETRVWERKRDSTGTLVWKNVHFHRSSSPINN